MTALLELAPRVRVEARGVVWADARGLRASALARALVLRLHELGVDDVAAGVATSPIAAELAAKLAGAEPEWPGLSRSGVGKGAAVAVVEDERRFLAPVPLTLLEPDESLLSLLGGVGVTTCGELAALELEAVEVRFGPEGVDCWRLARGEDRRLLFDPIPRSLPHASVDFVDYVLTDPARLIFAANALLGHVCEELAGRGLHARRLELGLELANGERWRRTLHAARPTASRETWLRRVRAQLERLTVPDAIAGIRIEVESVEEAGVRQGDLFDQGFATAAAVEAALERLIESYGPVAVTPEVDAHPLLERRTRWSPVPVTWPSGPTGQEQERRNGSAGRRTVADRVDVSVAGSVGSAGVSGSTDLPASVLTLQLLEAPRPIRVETGPRRDHEAPVRIRDGNAWQPILAAAGPDRVSGEPWGDVFSREYFRCFTADGRLVWIFRDRLAGQWFLHGWWD